MHGYREQGTTTTPFDMVVLNETVAITSPAKRCTGPGACPAAHRSSLSTAQETLERHHVYIVEHLEDMPEVRDWTWSEP